MSILTPTIAGDNAKAANGGVSSANESLTARRVVGKVLGLHDCPKTGSGSERGGGLFPVRPVSTTPHPAFAAGYRYGPCVALRSALNTAKQGLGADWLRREPFMSDGIKQSRAWLPGQRRMDARKGAFGRLRAAACPDNPLERGASK